MRAFLAVLPLMAAISSAGTAPPSPPPVREPPAVTVAIAAVEVVSAGLGEKGTELQPFGHPPGTRVAFLVRSGAPFAVVALDTQRSALDELRDGAGQVLAGARLEPGSRLGADGRAALAEVRTRGVPGPRAAALGATGRVALAVAGGSSTLRASGVKLRDGAHFTLGGARIDVAAAPGGAAPAITLQGPVEILGAVKALRITAARKAIAVGQWTAGLDGDRASVTFTAALPAASVDLELEAWSDLRALTVPFALQAGIGLGDPRAPAGPAAGVPAPGPLGLGLTAVGVRVVAGADATEAPLLPLDDEDGTRVALALTAPPGLTLVSVDVAHAEMLDAAGAALEGAPAATVRVAADASAALIELKTAGRPPESATGLRLRGRLDVGLASGAQVVKVPSVLLQAGDTFRLAGRVIAVREVQTTPDAIQFTVEGAAAALDPVRGLRFRPRGQAPVPAVERGRSSAGGVAAVAFRVATQEPAGDFEFESWREPRRLPLDFDLPAGLGLPALSSPHP